MLPNGKVLVAGGDGYSGTHLYDPDTNSWAPAAPMLVGILQTATLLPGGKVLVTRGATASLYDAPSDTWSAGGTLVIPRMAHTATLLPSGKVLVAGGVTNNDYTATAELYDPATNTWTEAGAMATPRYWHTATLLPNGKVLVAGGYDGSGAPVATAELYDPTTNTWTTAAPMTLPHAVHTATLLDDGRLLVTGGFLTTFDSWTASSEMYQDYDNDFLSDTYESSHSCLDPHVPDAQADPDTDGLPSLVERNLQTDPARTILIPTAALTAKSRRAPPHRSPARPAPTTPRPGTTSTTCPCLPIPT